MKAVLDDLVCRLPDFVFIFRNEFRIVLVVMERDIAPAKNNRSDPAAQLVLSPNLNPDFLNVFLSKLTSQPLPLLSDQCDDPKKDCSILVPILHFSGFRFRLCRVFIRPVHSMICDLILQNIRSCDSSLLIMYSIAENIKL
jgi:hypothetical protein